MIYLFDDTSDSFIREYINPLEYTDVLCMKGRMSMEELSAMTPSLLEGGCILLHKSLRDNGDEQEADNAVYRQLSSKISSFGKNVPLVLFSDGDLETPVFHSDTCIKSIKKTRFYTNLPSFLDEVRKTGGQVSLNVIAYGADMRETAVAAGHAVLSAVTFLDDDSKVEMEDGLRESLSALLNMSQPDVGVVVDDVLDDIEDGIITAGELRNHVRQTIDSFVSYGENIHSWK